MQIDLNITSRDIGYLWNTGHTSFYHEQADRFEVMEGQEEPDQGGIMIWCGEQYLNAKIIMDYFDAIGGEYRLVCMSLLWDLVEGEWVIWFEFDSIDDLKGDYEAPPHELEQLEQEA
jgi:hypothetical protein